MAIPINFSYERSGNVEAFDYYASLSVVAAAQADIFSIRTPTSFRRGFITLFGHGIDDPSAFVTSIFSIRVNNIPDRYYENIVDQLAPFNEPREIAPILIRPNDILSVRVTNNAAATKLFAARIRGFFDYGFAGKD